ncbi:MAG: hypothetical protein EX270_09465 [Pseudomonadales bacterium]|nr:MAG: hypothetical protein EX270_09465 [Pseudomonadales bacterium]
MNRLFCITATVLVGLFVSPATLCADVEAGKEIGRLGHIADDYYAAGAKVSVDADVAGDVVVAGGKLTINGRILEDLTAAGGSVSVRGIIRDDIRVAGGKIDIAAEVGDDLIAAGGDITLGSSTSINGDTRLAGGNITLAGKIQGDVVVVGSNLTISGTIHGDVEYIGNQIRLLDDAIIKGDLKYQSQNKAKSSPGATIIGATYYEEKDWNSDSRGFSLFFIIPIVVALALFLLVFPNYSVESARRIGAEPVKSVGIGFLLLIFTPIAAIFSMSIVLGVWIGLTLLAFYAVALLTGYLVGCISVGDWGARLLKQDLSTRGRRIASAALAVLLLSLVAVIPIIGNLLVFILLLAGLGAGFLQLNLIYRR